MNIQIFGTKKSFDTKKAQRYFKERRISFQFIDLKEKGMSKGAHKAARAEQDAAKDVGGPVNARHGACGDDAHHARGADDQGCSAKAPFADTLHSLDHGRAAHSDGKQRVR